MTAATVNVTPHILIENGVIVCGAQNHYGKRPKAKTVVLDLTKPGKRMQPEEGTYAEARDGVKVSIGSAYCGTHKPEHRALTILPDMVLDLTNSGTPQAAAILLDYAKRMYEKRLDEDEARAAEQNARWAKHRQDDHANSTFTARRTDERGEAKWLIEGHNPDVREGEPYPMTWVEVSNDGGVLWVTTSDYMNSGPGRGNPSWTKVFIETMQAAAEVQAAGVQKEGN